MSGRHKENRMTIMLTMIVMFLLGVGVGWHRGFSNRAAIKRLVKECPSNFNGVYKMYENFLLIDNNDGMPKLIPDEAAVFRLKAMHEELEELEDGYREQDLPKIADSIVDLVVFALGTAVLHNLPWEDLFKEVMRANMEKVPQFTNAKARNGSGSIDLIKPAGWRGPKIKPILEDHGWVDPEA